MEDDDDAFLYGEDPAPKQEATAPEVQPIASDAPAPDGATNGKTDATESADESDDDEEEDDSDSDIEFIIDAAQEGEQAAARPGFQRPGAPPQAPPRQPSTITSEYTPLARGQPIATPALAQALANTAAVKPDAEAREGGPPSVPSTAPRLNLSPGPEDREYPKPEDKADEDEVQGQDIFDVDIDTIAEKPWRRYGADLSDYFNYGFNEDTWNVWRGKKERMTEARKQAEMQTFGGPMGMMPQMMGMMPPQMQAMQAMMAQQAGGPGPGPGPMGMPPEMMAMMAGMGGMPPMAAMNPNANRPVLPGMFNASRPNGGQFGGEQQTSQHTPQHRQRGHSEAPSDRRNDREATPRQADIVKEESKDDAVDAPIGAPPANLPMKPMSGADMSAFFGASGVDMSQVAAAGLKVGPEPDSLNAAADTKASASPIPSAAKGASIRGRAAAVSTSDPKSGVNSPSLASKPAGKKYNDRDSGMGTGDALDYGAHASHNDDRGGRDRHEDRRRPWDEEDSRDRRDAGGWDRDDRHSRHRNDDRTPRSRNHYDSRDRGTGFDDSESSSARRGPSSRSKRDELDDETASQSSAGGRHRRPPVGPRDDRSHRSERPRERESSSRHNDDRERERERESRNQLRAERRAGKDSDDYSSATGISIRGSRKRAAPEDHHEDSKAAEHNNSSDRRTSAGRKKR